MGAYIDKVLVAGELGYLELDGPFEMDVDGFEWSVCVDRVSDVQLNILKDSIGEVAFALGGGEVEAFGELQSVDEIEGEMYAAFLTPGKP